MSNGQRVKARRGRNKKTAAQSKKAPDAPVIALKMPPGVADKVLRGAAMFWGMSFRTEIDILRAQMQQQLTLQPSKNQRTRKTTRKK